MSEVQTSHTDMQPQEIVAAYLNKNFRVVFWPAVGDAKGPTEKDWTRKQYSLSDYDPNAHRVGIMTGTEIAPGKFLCDTDIDWAPGSLIAQSFLPVTPFVYGRKSKHISHCVYYTNEPLPSFKYDDPIDKTTLIELRGTKKDGDIGFQSMVPPSVWSKEGKQELLTFVRFGEPALVEAHALRQRVCLAAIGMLLAKHLGVHGFGHETRLAWAGTLLRAGLSVDELVTMGEAMSTYCDNTEISDVRRCVESTHNALSSKDHKKISGAKKFAEILGDAGKKIISRINEWLGRDSDFIRNANGAIIKDNQENIKKALSLLDIEVSYNSFAERMLISEQKKEAVLIDDAILNRLWLRIDREFRFRPTFDFFVRVIQDTAVDNPFHPVRQYFDGLTWDGVPRINRWLSRYGGAVSANPAYLEAVSALVLIAAVRRVKQPGCKFDEMLVLEGAQGISKSSALRALVPQSDWFSDDLPLNIEAKQIIERTLGKFIIEASDLSGKKKADQEHLKAMLSRQVDGPARMAYARVPVERPRQFIIIGTTNSSQFLADQTGARRYWPVTVYGFDIEGIVKNRDQLWAEAVYREYQGESIRLDESLWPEATEEQEKRRDVDAWEDILRNAILDVEPKIDGKRRISNNMLWSALAVQIKDRDRYGGNRIAEIMSRFGFRRTTVRIDGGKPETGFISEVENLSMTEDEEVMREPGEEG